MRVPYIDLHGFKVDEAITKFHQFIGHHLIEDDTDYVQIITGNGVIKVELIKELDKMELEYMIEDHNLGRITVILRY